MAYRKVDPRTKAAAIKAVGKAVEAGSSAYAAARELSAKYGIGTTTLQKYYIEATDGETETLNDTAGQRKRTRRVRVVDGGGQAPESVYTTEESAAHADDERSERVTPALNRPLVGKGGADVEAAVSAEALSEEFTSTLATISNDFVVQLQAAALDDLIGKMQGLRAQLQQQ